MGQKGETTMNRIPRKFDTIIATPLCGNAEGRKLSITKDERGYHGREIETGKMWAIFISHLRNENFYRIEKIYL